MTRSNGRGLSFWAWLIGAVLVVYGVGAYRSYEACQRSGGTLVRGVVWYACVR